MHDYQSLHLALSLVPLTGLSPPPGSSQGLAPLSLHARPLLLLLLLPCTTFVLLLLLGRNAITQSAMTFSKPSAKATASFQMGEPAWL